MSRSLLFTVCRVRYVSTDMRELINLVATALSTTTRATLCSLGELLIRMAVVGCGVPLAIGGDMEDCKAELDSDCEVENCRVPSLVVVRGGSAEGC